MKKKNFFILTMISVCSTIMSITSWDYVNMFASNKAHAYEDLKAEIWNRYDYNLDNGTPAVNCRKGGCQDCLLH